MVDRLVGEGTKAGRPSSCKTVGVVGIPFAERLGNVHRLFESTLLETNSHLWADATPVCVRLYYAVGLLNILHSRNSLAGCELRPGCSCT